jgi:hypothetical protein
MLSLSPYCRISKQYHKIGHDRFRTPSQTSESIRSGDWKNITMKQAMITVGKLVMTKYD